MTFNSIEFASFFFIVISLCAVWPQARTLRLIVASFIFYSWTSWTFGLIFSAISICGYFASPLFAQLKAHRARIANTVRLYNRNSKSIVHSEILESLWVGHLGIGGKTRHFF